MSSIGTRHRVPIEELSIVIDNKYLSSANSCNETIINLFVKQSFAFSLCSAHGTEIRCESVGSARKWPQEYTSDGVITIGAHRLRRQCRSMIAMDGHESEEDKHASE